MTVHASNRDRVVAHMHHDVRYSVNSEGRCSWYTCTNNVYNSFDKPEREIKSDNNNISIN